MFLRKPRKLLPPLKPAALGNQEKYALRSSGVQPVLSTRSVAGVLDLLFLRRRLLQQRDRLGRGVGRLEVDEQLAQLGVQLAALGRDSAGRSRAISRAAVASSGRPKRLKTTW